MAVRSASGSPERWLNDRAECVTSGSAALFAAPLRCWKELPDLFAGHATDVIRHCGNYALEEALGLRSSIFRFDAFCVIFARVFAILDMVCFCIEEGESPPTLSLLSSRSLILALADVPSSKTVGCQKPRPIKNRPTIPEMIRTLMVTFETFISLMISKPPPRMATANKISPKMKEIVCSVIALFAASSGAAPSRDQ